jgi:tetratricopeptide (TPR) repeat protein
MENHFDVDILMGYKAKFMGLTYTRLGEIYLNNGIALPALDSYKNALKCFLNLPTYSLANTYRRIGGSYYLDQQTDSALYYYREAIDLAKKQNKTTVYSSSLAEAAPLYYEMSYIDSAFFMIREALTLPMNNDQRLKKYYVLGTFFAKECVYDSAVFYLEKSVNSNSYATRTVSAEKLIDCYQMLGDTAKTQYYIMIYGENFSKYRDNSDLTTELIQIYEIHKQGKLQKEHLKSIKKRNWRIIICSSVTFIIIIILVVIISKRIHYIKKKSHDDIEEKDKALAEMKRKMEANPFVKESICKYILDVVNKQHFKSKVDCIIYKEFALDKSQLLALRDAADRHYDGFTQRLQKEYPELSYDDIDYCCLYLLGVKDADISALMQKDYSTICRRRRKISSLINMDKILVSNCNTTI